MGGGTEVRGGNPPFPRVLYETLQVHAHTIPLLVAASLTVAETGVYGSLKSSQAADMAESGTLYTG